MTFGKVVSFLRRRSGLTQAQLAARIGALMNRTSYSQSNIGRVEADQYDPSLSFMQAMAEALELTLTELVGLVGRTDKRITHSPVLLEDERRFELTSMEALGSSIRRLRKRQGKDRRSARAKIGSHEGGD